MHSLQQCLCISETVHCRPAHAGTSHGAVYDHLTAYFIVTVAFTPVHSLQGIAVVGSCCELCRRTMQANVRCPGCILLCTRGWGGGVTFPCNAQTGHYLLMHAEPTPGCGVVFVQMAATRTDSGPCMHRSPHVTFWHCRLDMHVCSLPFA